MFKRVLIIVSILFVAISAVGCAGGGGGKQSVEKVEDFHALALENIDNFGLSGRKIHQDKRHITKIDVDKYIGLVKK
ncbi:MAG: hypothetical protein GX546_04830 [Acholeplasmataceae bacterium]|jgi:hypothetical protein|nr:hypothetical protein [Acholeplasmataceae bacterium]